MMTRLKNSLPAKPLQCPLRASSSGWVRKSLHKLHHESCEIRGSNEQSTKNAATHSHTLGGDSRAPSLA